MRVVSCFGSLRPKSPNLYRFWHAHDGRAARSHAWRVGGRVSCGGSVRSSQVDGAAAAEDLAGVHEARTVARDVALGALTAGGLNRAGFLGDLITWTEPAPTVSRPGVLALPSLDGRRPPAGPPSRTVTRSPSAARRSWPAADDGLRPEHPVRGSLGPPAPPPETEPVSATPAPP